MYCVLYGMPTTDMARYRGNVGAANSDRIAACLTGDCTGVSAEKLVGLGFLSISYIKSNPTHEKLFAVGKKAA